MINQLIKYNTVLLQYYYIVYIIYYIIATIVLLIHLIYNVVNFFRPFLLSPLM